MGYDEGPKFTLGGAAPLTRPLAEKNLHIRQEHLTLPKCL